MSQPGKTDPIDPAYDLVTRIRELQPKIEDRIQRFDHAIDDWDKRHPPGPASLSRVKAKLGDPGAKASELSQISVEVMREIDRRAARKFSMFHEQAKGNGYGFQAYLVEKKVLPEVFARIGSIEGEIARFESSVDKDVLALISMPPRRTAPKFTPKHSKVRSRLLNRRRHFILRV